MATSGAASSTLDPSSCAEPLEHSKINMILILRGSMGVATALLCGFAIVLVLAFKLHRNLVYRLAAYQVTSAMLNGIVCILQIFSVYDLDTTTPLCEAVGFADMFTSWMQLMFTVCITVHLFVFTVFYVNLKKWEVAYAVSSVLVSIAISVVPFATGSYGRAGAWCWISNWKDNCPQNNSEPGLIEQFAIWYIPASVVLVVSGVAIVVITIVLVKRAYGKHLQEKWRRHKEALSQMLPLLAYPVLCIVLLALPIGSRARTATADAPLSVDYVLLAATAVCVVLMRMLSGGALLMHICILRAFRHYKLRHRVRYGATSRDSEVATVNGVSTEAHTFFEPLRENDVGDLEVVKII